MEKSIINVPVKVHIWVREDCQRAQFDVIKQVRPRVLFIQSDGGRTPEECAAIKKNREMYEQEIDWECTVHKIFSEENLGMYKMGAIADDVIWSHTDRCIFLEDDCIPSVSFFKYCETLLEKYKDDERIELICGMNSLEKCEEVEADYFFSKGGSIWGFATWKRVYDHFDRDKNYVKDKYVFEKLKNNTKGYNPKFYKQIIGYAENDTFNGHIPWYEFYMALDLYANNRLNIIPKYNMISCFGCTDNSAHSSAINVLPKTIRNIFMMKSYEINFPLREPLFVIEDKEYYNTIYEILSGKNKFYVFCRKITVLFLHLKAGDFIPWIRKKISRRGKIEN